MKLLRHVCTIQRDVFCYADTKYILAIEDEN